MMKMLSAALALALQGMQTALDKILGLTASLIAFPFQVLTGGGYQRLPSQPPVFETPVAADDLAADLVAGPAPAAKIRDLDREGVNSVFRLAKMSKAEREIADLSAVERDDVRALLLTMTQSELDALTKAGPGPVRRLIVGGDAQVWGVPSVKPENVLQPSETEIPLRLRAVKAAMANPREVRPS